MKRNQIGTTRDDLLADLALEAIKRGLERWLVVPPLTADVHLPATARLTFPTQKSEWLYPGHDVARDRRAIEPGKKLESERRSSRNGEVEAENLETGWRRLTGEAPPPRRRHHQAASCVGSSRPISAR